MQNMNYGVIGNGQSAALISDKGDIEWCCLPAFDSASVFARLLDTSKGGHFGIRLKGRNSTVTQRYLPQTNILETIFSNGVDSFEVLDFMPRYKTKYEYICPPDIVRYIRPLSGNPQVIVDYAPKLGYAKEETTTICHESYLKSSCKKPNYESVYLYSDMDLAKIQNAKPIALDGERYLWLSYNEKIEAPCHENVRLQYERTKVYWMDWVDQTRDFARWHDTIERSMLVLKLLAYQRTGAVLAAITTSLPEDIGSVRNWDYRFCWLRDASMVVKVFTQLGHYRVSSRYLNFILDVISYKDENVQIMYGINRQKQLKEEILPWLSGYEDSAPVRIGNAAYKQKQHDIYGFVLDTIYQRIADHPHSVDNIEGIWTVVRTLVRHVEKQWRKPDAGIWEIRGEKKHFVFSKVLCWVAIDRAIKIAELLDKSAYVAEWSPLRGDIYEQVMSKGYNADIQAFSQAYGDEHMDASNLLMEHYGMIEADDPRYIGTVNRCFDELCQNGLMFRYKNTDDFGEPHSAFTVCTFWMIKSLHRIGRKELAAEMFDNVVAGSNHLGLLSEDMDFKTRRLLGNFPQGYSHLALIDTAMALSE